MLKELEHNKTCRMTRSCGSLQLPAFWSVFAGLSSGIKGFTVSSWGQQRHKSRNMSKPTKWHVPPAKTQISLGIRPVWSVFAVRMKKAWVLSYPLSTQQRLIRLGGCPGWSESSLGTQSFCLFCHVATHDWLHGSGLRVHWVPVIL